MPVKELVYAMIFGLFLSFVGAPKAEAYDRLRSSFHPRHLARRFLFGRRHHGYRFQRYRGGFRPNYGFRRSRFNRGFYSRRFY